MTDDSTLPLPGSIGLVRIEGLVGQAIRVAQLLDGDGFRDFEHAFVLYSRGIEGDPDHYSTVIEAEVGGVRLAPLSEYRGRQVLWIPCPPEYSTGMMTAAMTYYGVPYSFTDYAAIAAHHLRTPLLGRTLKDWVESSHHVICSQLAVACADKAGWPLVANSLWPGYATPGALARLAPAGQSPVRIK